MLMLIAFAAAWVFTSFSGVQAEGGDLSIGFDEQDLSEAFGFGELVTMKARCFVGKESDGHDIAIKIRNNTKKAIGLQEVQKGCGCFDVEYLPERLAPSQIASLKIRVPARTLAEQNKQLSLSIQFEGGRTLRISIPVQRYPLIGLNSEFPKAGFDLGIIEVDSSEVVKKHFDFSLFSSDREKLVTGPVSAKAAVDGLPIATKISYEGLPSVSFLSEDVTIYRRNARLDFEGSFDLGERSMPFTLEILAPSLIVDGVVFSGFLRELSPFEVSRKVLVFSKESNRQKLFVSKKDGAVFEQPRVFCDAPGIKVEDLGSGEYSRNSYGYLLSLDSGVYDSDLTALNHEFFFLFRDHRKRIGVKLLGSTD